MQPSAPPLVGVRGPTYAIALLLTIFSSALQIALFPKPDWTFLCWIAFVPWLWALLARRAGGWRTWLGDFAAGWLCGALWYLGTCYWIFYAMRTHGGLGRAAASLVVGLFCLYLGLYHALFAGMVSWLRSRAFPLRWLLLAIPVLWTATELARSRVTAFPWDLLGYTQLSNLPLARIATVTGVFGMSFVIMLVNAAIAGGILLRRNGAVLLLAGGIAACVLQSGALVQQSASVTNRTAVLVQEDLPLESEPWSAAYFDSVMAELANSSEPPNKNLQSGADHLIVWPESPAPFFLNDQRFVRWMDALAGDAHSWIIAGSLGVEGRDLQSQRLYNAAALISPDGHFVKRYDKIHLVPFGEYVPMMEYLGFAKDLTMEVGGFARGHDRQLLDAGPIRAGTFICYESVFPDEIRQFAKLGANVLVNISNDGWFGEAGAQEQHLRMARMRAVENRRWLLRVTNDGITAVVDPLGRITQTLPVHERAALLAKYALTDSPLTFYTRHGDWFSYACAIIAIVALLFAATSGRRI